ncbi:hypothetical protein D1BOALGB6SA_6831 [Olavius sp. associated proteobacterium Delta 1]|nr:hypothetical protein D1BOALGB6SA_6831 [Olavius sp. associated proteobacterium Delta 1]
MFRQQYVGLTASIKKCAFCEIPVYKISRATNHLQADIDFMPI